MPQGENDKLSTDPYKGVRDFYPRDMFLENYITSVMRETAERYGYVEYGASILERTELYTSKTSDEIVNEQTYTFEDRGGRSVTLRPEMTPSVARMVAAKRRELAFPLRLYSMPNIFRYERPQRGRLREHWQLNCDLFGVPGVEADAEVITLAHKIMRAFGAQDKDFEILINDRRTVVEALSQIGLEEKQVDAFLILLDKRSKFETEVGFMAEAENMIGKERFEAFEQWREKEETNSHQAGELIGALSKLGVDNVRVDTSLVRGFLYYTGTVFEVFDTIPQNRRSLFGGGRYDNLLEVFGAENIPAVGFGMGDVTMRDFLETRNLLPEYISATDLYLCVLGKDFLDYAGQLAEKLREQGLNVALDPTARKAADQIKTADKHGVLFVACVGGQEQKNKTLTVKNLKTGNETTVPEDKVGDFIWNQDV